MAPLSPVEQKQAYLNVQAGGEVPLQGFQKPAPEKPKGMCTHYTIEHEFIYLLIFGHTDEFLTPNRAGFLTL